MMKCFFSCPLSHFRSFILLVQWRIVINNDNIIEMSRYHCQYIHSHTRTQTHVCTRSKQYIQKRNLKFQWGFYWEFYADLMWIISCACVFYKIFRYCFFFFSSRLECLSNWLTLLRFGIVSTASAHSEILSKST